MAVNVLVTHFGLQTSRHNNLESDTCWKGTLLESAYFGLQTNRQEIILNLIPVGGHNYYWSQLTGHSSFITLAS